MRAQRLEVIKAGKKNSSPLKNFSVTAPALCLGTKIQKSNEKNRGMVAFISDVGRQAPAQSPTRWLKV